MTKKPFIIAFAVLFISLAQFNSDVYLPSFPSMKEFFSVGPGEIQFTISIVWILFGISLLIYGPLSDYFGRKKTALIGIGFFIVGCFFTIFAKEINIFYLGRALQGIGAGCCGAISPAMARDVYSGKKLARAFSYISMSIAAIPIIAPVIGGYLQYNFGWQSNFVFLAIYAFILLLMVYFVLPETCPHVKENKLHVKHIFKTYLHILKNPSFFVATVAVILVVTGEISYLIISPFLIQTQLKFTPVQYGQLAIFTISGYIIGATISSHLCKTIKSKSIIAIGILVLLSASISMMVLSLNYFNVFVIIAPMFFYMLGAGLIYPNCFAMSVNEFPKNSGLSGALISSLQMGVGGLISWFVTRLSVETQKPLSFILIAVSVVLGIVFLILRKRVKSIHID